MTSDWHEWRYRTAVLCRLCNESNPQAGTTEARNIYASGAFPSKYSLRSDCTTLTLSCRRRKPHSRKFLIPLRSTPHSQTTVVLVLSVLVFRAFQFLPRPSLAGVCIHHNPFFSHSSLLAPTFLGDNPARSFDHLTSVQNTYGSNNKPLLELCCIRRPRKTARNMVCAFARRRSTCIFDDQREAWTPHGKKVGLGGHACYCEMQDPQCSRGHGNGCLSAKVSALG
jgi:hypothetical protein